MCQRKTIKTFFTNGNGKNLTNNNLKSKSNKNNMDELIYIKKNFLMKQLSDNINKLKRQIDKLGNIIYIIKC